MMEMEGKRKVGKDDDEQVMRKNGYIITGNILVLTADAANLLEGASFK